MGQYPQLHFGSFDLKDVLELWEFSRSNYHVPSLRIINTQRNYYPTCKIFIDNVCNLVIIGSSWNISIYRQLSQANFNFKIIKFIQSMVTAESFEWFCLFVGRCAIWYHLCLRVSTCETRKNDFYFTSKALFVLEKFKF